MDVIAWIARERPDGLETLLYINVSSRRAVVMGWVSMEAAEPAQMPVDRVSTLLTAVNSAQNHDTAGNIMRRRVCRVAQRPQLMYDAVLSFNERYDAG